MCRGQHRGEADLLFVAALLLVVGVIVCAVDRGGGGDDGDVATGGVVFNLTSSETVENNGVFTISADDVIAITGGFAMIIQLP
jgi:hypothetical protein